MTGFTDPDLHRLTRNSPTCVNMAIMATLQVASSGWCHAWDLCTADITTAFLQGAQEKYERSGKLCMRAPTDPLVAASGSFQEAELYEVVGNFCGLANAPFLFSKVVRSKMKRLGFVERSLDCMLFLFYKNGEFVAIACFHVDDMLLACAPTYDFTGLRDAFTWGPWSSLRQCSLKFTGHQFRLRNDDIIVHQQEFTLSTPTKRLRVGPATDRLLQAAEEYSE